MPDLIEHLPMHHLVWVHAAATWYMVGLIWFVQLVHYPLKAYIAADRFVEYQHQHMRRTTWAVGPAMLVEAATVVIFIVISPPRLAILAWCGAGLLLVIWAATAAFQVPLHHRLTHGKDMDTIRQLVRTNWIRTIAWSARAGVAYLMFS
ncbi:MAG: hypothetical protein VX589_19695 [Myxococcota bacterium]|nr:hypothetical protein [Myxococcota bacterium]